MPKKIEVKVKFVVTIKNLFNLDEDSEGKEVWVSWKRGKKSQNKGDTKKATVNSSRIAVIGENFTIQSTLFQDEKTKKFESKKLELNVKQDVNNKRTKPLGVVAVDLGEYATQGDHDVNIPIKLKKKSKDASTAKAPSVKLSVKTQWTHYNKKLIVPKKEGKGSSSSAAGEDFDLLTITTNDQTSDETTRGDMSETDGSDSTFASASDDDDSDFEKDDSKKGGGASEKVKETGGVGGDSKEWKKQLAKADKLAKEKDKLLRKYEKEIQTLKGELEKEKEATKEKLMKLNNQTQESKKLKKELAKAKKLLPDKGKTLKAEPEDEMDKLEDALDKEKENSAKLQEELKKTREELNKRLGELGVLKDEFEKNIKSGKGGGKASKEKEKEKDVGDMTDGKDRAVAAKEEIIQNMKRETEGMRKELDDYKKKLKNMKQLPMSVSTDRLDIKKSGGGPSELDEYKLVERLVYCANLSFDDGDSEDEGDKRSEFPIAAEDLFKLLMTQRLLDSTAQSNPFLTHLSHALKTCIERSKGDYDMQCGWLAYVTSFIHMTVNDKSLQKQFGKESDPQRAGIAVDHPKRKYASAASQFMDDLQKQALKAFNNLQKCLQRKIRPLLTPSLLDQPATLLRNSDKHNKHNNNKHNKDNNDHNNKSRQRHGISPQSIKSTSDIIVHLEEVLEALLSHNIFPVVVRQFFVQTFYLIGAETFNQIMEESRYCSYNNAFQIKFAVAQLLSWVSSKSRTLAFGRTRAQLDCVVEAVNVIIMEKQIFTDVNQIQEAFRVLNPIQIMHILDSYQPDEAGDKVPSACHGVLTKMAAKAKSAKLQIDTTVTLPWES